MSRIDAAEVSAERVAHQFGDRAGHLDAGWTTTHNDDGQKRRATRWLGADLSILEGLKKPRTNGSGIGDGLGCWRRCRPFGMGKVVVGRTSCDHELVERDVPSLRKLDMAPCRVDPLDVGQHDVDILCMGKHAPDRDRDVSGRKSCCRHLVEEWLEQVVIALVDEGHVHLSACKRSRACQAAKATPDDDDMALGATGAWGTVKVRCRRHGLSEAELPG